MTVDDTYKVGIEADTSAFDKALGDMTLKAGAFGSAFSTAMRGAVSGGQSFDGVLRQLALRLSSIALGGALKPIGDAAGARRKNV